MREPVSIRSGAGAHLPPPPAPTPRERVVFKASAVTALDGAHARLEDAIKDFSVAGDEDSKVRCRELADEVESLLTRLGSE